MEEDDVKEAGNMVAQNTEEEGDEVVMSCLVSHGQCAMVVEPDEQTESSAGVVDLVDGNVVFELADGSGNG